MTESRYLLNSLVGNVLPLISCRFPDKKEKSLSKSPLKLGLFFGVKLADDLAKMSIKFKILGLMAINLASNPFNASNKKTADGW